MVNYVIDPLFNYGNHYKQTQAKGFAFTSKSLLLERASYHRPMLLNFLNDKLNKFIREIAIGYFMILSSSYDTLCQKFNKSDRFDCLSLSKYIGIGTSSS